MNLSFDEVSRYTIMKTACAEIGMESLSSESIKITKRLTSDIASLETEYERAIQSGDYQKAVDICDQMLSMLDEAGTKLKSLNPDKLGLLSQAPPVAWDRNSASFLPREATASLSRAETPRSLPDFAKQFRRCAWPSQVTSPMREASAISWRA